MAVVFGAMSVGANAAFAADFAMARLSAARMIAILDRLPAIDAFSTEGIKPVLTVDIGKDVVIQ